MISMKDYAKANGITYEAVRAQVKRYREQLDDHIIQDGRTQYLDDIAVAFLDEKRQKNPVVVYQQGKDERIEELESNEKAMLVKIAAQADRIAELAQWKADKALEIASAEQTRLLLTAAEQEKKLLEGFVADAKAEIAVLSDEKAKAEGQALEASERAQKAQDELTAALAELADRKAHPWRYLFRNRKKED